MDALLSFVRRLLKLTTSWLYNLPVWIKPEQNKTKQNNKTTKSGLLLEVYTILP